MPVPSKDDYPYRMVHVDGCGGDMFFLKRQPEGGDPVVSADAIYPEGQIVDLGSPMICIVCGTLVRGLPQVSWVVPRE